MDIPYTTELRQDTGLYNGKLGMWLFLASEMMLFGGLFSAYVFLRAGSESWPVGADQLNVPMATVNTMILIASSISIVFSWAAYKTGAVSRGNAYLAITIALSLAFTLIKGYEYADKFEHGYMPSTSNFYAVYFVLTGMHLAHIVGGLLVFVHHLAFSRRLRREEPERFTNRIEVTGLYWHFVDMIWLVLFPALYLT